MDNLIWCYCRYEVPYRGVSAENPAGHLLMALRNKGEKQHFKEPYATFFTLGNFSYVSNQLLLRGIMGLSDWQLLFVPCINQNEVNSSTVVSVRQTLLRALQSTEPNFYHLWATGLPGSIPLAKVDHILAVDRRQRVYKFDPITSLWTRYFEKFKSNTVRLPKHTEIPHVPARICFFNTDLSVFAFQLCLPHSNNLNSTETRKLRKDSKLFLRRFISKVCARISFIRRSSGSELTQEFCISKSKSCYPHPTDHISRSSPLDLFSTYQSNDQTQQDCCDNDNLYHEVLNCNPINPLHRLNQSWFNFAGKFKVFENESFSYCRTLPLQIPTVWFNKSMLFVRDMFHGHRFPVLSQYYEDYYCLDYGCWLLRSGTLHPHLNLEQILNLSFGHVSPSSNKQTPDPKVAKRHLFHICLRETTLETVYSEFESMQAAEHSNLETHGNSLFDLLSTSRQSSPAIWANRKHSRSFSDTPPVHLVVPDPFSPDYLSPSLDMTQSEFSWSTPKCKLVEQAWVQLGNLVRLPQTFVPGIEVSLDSNANTTSSSTNVNDELLIDDTGLSQTCDSPRASSVDRLNFAQPENLNNLAKMNQSWIDENFPDPGRNRLLSFRRSDLNRSFNQLNLSSPNKRFSVARLFPGNTKAVITDVSLASSPTPTSPSNRLGAPNQMKPVFSYPKRLNLMSAQRGPHRSDWYQYVESTNWLNLIWIALKQASLLVELLRQLCFNQTSGYPGAFVIVTGPGSGRTWQCILMSLSQIMFSTEARTLKGFEDLIEREWVRYGYPFAPDPSDWHDSSVHPEYDSGASFALFLDCVHQLMVQFPTEFAFTEDYLVLLLDTALSRGGGLPPFAIEFACSCEAARTVCGTAKTTHQIQSDCQSIYKHGAWRSFRDWHNVLSSDGLKLLPNWCFWWQYSLDPLRTDNSSLINEFNSSVKPSQILFPILSPPSYLRFWVHGWLRWLRALRLSTGGGYAFDASYYRQLLSPSCQTDKHTVSCLNPKTSASPYTGWMSDEAILNASTDSSPNLFNIRDPVFDELCQMALFWDIQDDSPYN